MKNDKKILIAFTFILCLLPLFPACGSVVKAGDAESDGECPTGRTWCEGECIDTATDNFNCGQCDRICQQPPNASGSCVSSECVFECSAGWWDDDNNLEDGCEYECTPSGDPNDGCDGIDDDCDGRFDEDAGLNACRKNATDVPCTTTCGSQTTTTCDDDCIPGDCVPPAEECNGADDDCVVGPDNGFACIQNQTTACTTSCGSTGTGVCSALCTLPAPDSCTPPAETCNWVDDDCDAGGEIDEGLFGVVVEDVPITDGLNETGSPLIAFGASNYVVAWEDERDGHPAELYTRAVGLDGSDISGDVRVIGNSGSENLGDMVWNGDRFGLTYYSMFDSTTSTYEVWVSTINTDADMLDRNKSIENTNDQVFPSIAWDGSHWALSLFDERISSDNFNIYFAQVDTLGLNIVAGTEKPVSTSMIQDTYPDIAWSGSTYAVAWNQLSGSYRNVHVRILDQDGTFASTILLVTDGYAGTFNPAIVWTGSEWIVSWAGEKSGGAKGYFLARLDGGGNVVPSSETMIDTYDSIAMGIGTPMKIADAVGLGLGAVWQKYVTDGRTDILFQRFTYDLEPIGDIIPIMIDGESSTPSLAWDGDGFGIVWTNKIPETTSSLAVHFARVGCQ